MDVSARLWSPVAAMAVASVPGGRLVLTGVLRLVVVPSPNSPSLFSPQARRVSDAVPDGAGVFRAAAGHAPATACVAVTANTRKNKPTMARPIRSTPALRPGRWQILRITPTSTPASIAIRTDASVNQLSRIDAEKRP